MDKYIVTGMSCAACQARVEKAVNSLEGVTECSVSLLTNSMGVSGTASPEKVIAAVRKAGYDASLKNKSSNEDKHMANDGLNGNGDEDDDYGDMLADRESPKMVRRLIWSLIFLIPLMYVSMGHMMWNWPLPSFLEGNHVAMGIYELLLTGLVMVINQKFFVNGFKGLINRAPNMDTLVALGSMASFVYSVYALFAMTDASMNGDASAVMRYMDEFYFESAAMILTLITVGKLLEARSKGRTTDAIKGLMKLAPKQATVIREGREVKISVKEVRKGDVFLVKPGENIPVDGIVLEGNSAVNESALTGESIPVDKSEGDEVSAATLNTSGFLKCEATRVGSDTTLSQIIRMVSDAAATKAPIAKIADKVSGVFVPVVITIAVVTIIVWLLCGYSVGFALARGISVLVISCPCALGLATPVAIMVGSGMGAKNGIMFKTAVSLEETGKISIVALDKTGTITSGEPRVTDILAIEGFGEDELLKIAYSLEKKSEHPLAGAIVKYADERKTAAYQVDSFEVAPGNGLKGMIDGAVVVGGKASFVEGSNGGTLIEGNIKDKAKKYANEGKTPLYFARDGSLCGVIAVADVIKADARQAVSELKNMGVRVVMLTGDNELTAKAIGRQAGVDEVIAGVLPDGKEEVIRQLKEEGKVAMVGDGINDAPALTRADIGIAIGAGTDIAIDAADLVLMKSELRDVPAAIRLSRATLRNIHENLFWAFIYNVIGIPLAAGVYYNLLGWKLNPMFGAAAMSLSSFCVVSNALRLNLFRIYDAGKDKIRNHSKQKMKSKNKEKEKKIMKKTMVIKGMMCGHCEANVKKALEAIPQVEEAVVSHEAGTAVVTLKEAVDDAVLKKAVEDKDYEVVSID